MISIYTILQVLQISFQMNLTKNILYLHLIKLNQKNSTNKFNQLLLHLVCNYLHAQALIEKTVQSNIDMYILGQQFLQHKKEKQQQLIHQLETKFQLSCPFSPQITSNSRIIAFMSKTIVNRGRQSSELIESQSIKLQKDLEEQILRSSPFYFRQIDWKLNLQEKLQAIRSQIQTISTISLNQHTKYLDLRASHALKKNISAKYLRQTLIQI